MALVLEKSLEDVKTFLANNLPIAIAAVNADISDGKVIADVKDIITGDFDLFDAGDRYPRINMYIDDRPIEPLTNETDEFKERLIIIVGIKGPDGSLKCTRTAEAVRRCFLADPTAGAAVEFINVIRVRNYLPSAGITVVEITCQIQRQVNR